MAFKYGFACEASFCKLIYRDFPQGLKIRKLINTTHSKREAMEPSMIATVGVLAAITLGLFLFIRPDLGIQQHLQENGNIAADSSAISNTSDSGSGERTTTDQHKTDAELQDEIQANESQAGSGAGISGEGSGQPLIPGGAGQESSQPISNPANETGGGQGGQSGEWQVPDPFVPDPSVVLFTTPPKPLDDVTIYAIDVGTDAYFIDTPADDMLIDAGRISDGNAVISMLSSINKTSCEIVMASHHADDHIGGLLAVLQQMNVSWVMDSGSQMTSSVFSDYSTLANEKNFTIVKAGDRYDISPNITIEILHPAIYYPQAMEKDNSIVFRLVYRNFKMLFMGDCRRQCVDDLLNSGKDISADILKVGDHASINSTSQQLLDRVNATTAIISVGPDLAASYKVPNQAVLSRMSSRGMTIYRTDTNGNIAITTNGVSFQVLTQK